MNIIGIEKTTEIQGVPTIEDLAYGEPFTFTCGELKGDVLILAVWDSRGDFIIDVQRGIIYDADEYIDLPIKKLTCNVVIEG